MLAAAAASSSGFVLAPAFVDADGNVTREYGSLEAMQRDALRWTLPQMLKQGSFSAPDDESDEGPPVQQSFARRGSALLGAIGRRFSGQVEMGGGVV